MEGTNLKNHYVLWGEIDRGCIRVLSNDVPEPKRVRGNPNVSGLYYCEKLLEFSGKSYRAEICGEEVFVYDKNHFTVAKISQNDFRWVDQAHSGKYEVMAGGWLAPVKEKGEFASIIQHLRQTLSLIRQVEKGKQPPYHDNSPFYKVDSRLRKKIVTLLKFYPKDEAIVIDSKGNIIPHEVAYPLRYSS